MPKQNNDKVYCRCKRSSEEITKLNSYENPQECPALLGVFIFKIEWYNSVGQCCPFSFSYTPTKPGVFVNQARSDSQGHRRTLSRVERTLTAPPPKPPKDHVAGFLTNGSQVVLVQPVDGGRGHYVFPQAGVWDPSATLWDQLLVLLDIKLHLRTHDVRQASRKPIHVFDNPIPADRPLEEVAGHTKTIHVFHVPFSGAASSPNRRYYSGLMVCGSWEEFQRATEQLLLKGRDQKWAGMVQSAAGAVSSGKLDWKIPTKMIEQAKAFVMH